MNLDPIYFPIYLPNAKKTVFPIQFQEIHWSAPMIEYANGDILKLSDGDVKVLAKRFNTPETAFLPCEDGDETDNETFSVYSFCYDDF